ncbi:MAG: MFS transporter [Solirubrobacterales bacterium]|nr:MFS transporter [Solirubrobacterales bacterium]MBV9716455.1 MFS transporter [Solirubrobacterales bacterium]
MVAPRLRNVALLVAGCFFMELLDATIVVTAVPKISASLHVRPGTTALIITAYLVTVAVLIPLSAWMTLRLGYRRVFVSAIGIFTLASLGCALSQSFDELVAMRVLQGVGGAMMVPVGRMVVFEQAEKPQVMRLMSYIVWPGLVAPVIAPLAGGVITTYANWRWLFAINIPLGLVGVVAAWRLIEGRPTETPPPLDRVGVLLTCGGLTALTYAAHLVTEARVNWPLAAPLLVASVVLLAAATRHLLRAPTPLVDLRTLRIGTFADAMSGSVLVWLVIGSIPFLLPLLFQTVFGWSAIKSGAVVLFVFVGNIAIKPLTTPMYSTYGFRRVLLAATACLTLSTVGCALLTAATPVIAIALLALISGAARSVAMTGYSTLAMSDVPTAQMRNANALNATGQQLFTGLAVALSTVALRFGELLGDRGGRSPYVVAFLAVSLVGAAATAVAYRLHPTAGEVLTRREPVRT